MTSYSQIARDFILRTLDIIDQYEEIAREKLEPEHQYEVTLLMNCLLGLLIYPQQLASHKEYQSRFNRWLTDDKLVDIGHEWGIEPKLVQCAGHRVKGRGDNREDIPIAIEQLTLRNMIRQMRNTAAHARFSVNDANGQIESITFEDDSREHGFAITIPIANLERFVRKLAESARDRLLG